MSNNTKIPSALVPEIKSLADHRINALNKEIETLKTKLKAKEDELAEYKLFLELVEGGTETRLTKSVKMGDFDKTWSRTLQARYILNEKGRGMLIPEILTELIKVNPEEFEPKKGETEAERLQYLEDKFMSTMKQNIDKSKAKYFFRIEEERGIVYYLKEWE